MNYLEPLIFRIGKSKIDTKAFWPKSYEMEILLSYHEEKEEKKNLDCDFQILVNKLK